jgi:hypothetical protein
MTSGLKPNYVKFAQEICQFAFEGYDADGFTIQKIGVKCGVLKVEAFDEENHTNIVNAEDFEAGEDVYLFVEPSAVPDVPELVRYDLNLLSSSMVGNFDGKYVLHSQAAAIIAAERAEKERSILASNDMFKTAVGWQERAKAAEAELKTQKEINANLMGDDEDKPRYTTKRLKIEIENALKAKLAPYEAQESVGTIARVNHNGLSAILFKPYDSDFHVKDGAPVYASPAPCPDLKAVVERYKRALEIIGDGFVAPKDAPKYHDEAVNMARAALNTQPSPLAPEGGRE